MPLPTISMKRRATKSRVPAGNLEVLQAKGAATLAEVHQALERKIGYTTVQMCSRRMVDKGLCRREREWPAK